VNLNSVIIGGSSGIGLAIALKLEKSGYDVIVGSRKKTEKLKNISHKFLDVTNEDSIKFFFENLQLEYLNSIIYSAGITTAKKSIEHFDEGEYRKVHDVNILGAILTLKYAFPYLKKSKGKVVIINSIAGRTYSKFSGFEYTVTKTALSGLVKQLAVEWAGDEILINSVYPSMVWTSMLENNVERNTLDLIENEIPLKRIPKPDEITSIVEFLVSNKNTYITGVGIDFNGGQYLTG